MRYCSSDGSTGCSTDGECTGEEADGLVPAPSASGCSCFPSPTVLLHLYRLVIVHLASSHSFFLFGCCSLPLPLPSSSLTALQKKLKEPQLARVSCLPSHPPRFHQTSKPSDALMSFQSAKPISSLRLILSVAVTHRTQTDGRRRSSLFIIPAIPFCSSRRRHTPGELNALNVYTSRLLIDKLFMLSSGSIHITDETSHHSKGIQIEMQ